MAGQVIYQGDSEQPVHREFIDAHLLPRVVEVLGRGMSDVDVVFVRPEQARMTDAEFDRALAEAVRASHPGAEVVRTGGFDAAAVVTFNSAPLTFGGRPLTLGGEVAHDGYALVLIDDSVGAMCIYVITPPPLRRSGHSERHSRPVPRPFGQAIEQARRRYAERPCARRGRLRCPRRQTRARSAR